jgi:hypothetical protein
MTTKTLIFGLLFLAFACSQLIPPTMDEILPKLKEDIEKNETEKGKGIPLSRINFAKFARDKWESLLEDTSESSDTSSSCTSDTSSSETSSSCTSSSSSSSCTSSSSSSSSSSCDSSTSTTSSSSSTWDA